MTSRFAVLPIAAIIVLVLAYIVTKCLRVEVGDVRGSGSIANSGDRPRTGVTTQSGSPTASSLVIKPSAVTARAVTEQGNQTSPDGASGGRAVSLAKAASETMDCKVRSDELAVGASDRKSGDDDNSFGLGSPWGRIAEGQAISIAAEQLNSFETKKAVFTVGEQIKLCFWLKNFSKTDVVHPYDGPGGEVGLCGYILCVTRLGGEALPMTARGKQLLKDETQSDEMPRFQSLQSSGTVIRPGQSNRFARHLTQLYDLSRPGTYLVSARRRMVKPGGRLSEPALVSKQEGVSNTLEITIVDTGSDQLAQRLKDMEHPRDCDSNPALNLGETSITDADLRRIEGMTQLRQLSLSYAPNVTDAGLKRLLNALTNLEELYLEKTNITDAGLECVNALPRLRKLDLYCTKITNDGLRHLKGRRRLEELSIGYIRITDVGLEHLKSLTNLQCLDVAGPNGLTDAGLRYLRGMPQLRRLNLGFAKVSDVGLEQVKRFGNLEFLAVGSETVTDAGLLHLEGMTHLQRLSLCCPNVTDAGLRYLERLTQLRQLCLYCPKISDSGLTHIVGLTQLEHLEIGSEKVTSDGVKNLKQLLPHCSISNWPPPTTVP